jgi:hypothetical protein
VAVRLALSVEGLVVPLMAHLDTDHARAAAERPAHLGI